MNALQSFTFEDHGVRTLLRDEAPWFVLADVCRVLEIGNTSDAARRLDDDEKGVDNVDTLGGFQDATIINESGLYSLILTSRKAAAKRFKKWVTAELLPTLRRTGCYVIGSEDDLPLSADGKVFGMRVAKVNAAARLISTANAIYGPEAARALWEAEPGLPVVRGKAVGRLAGTAEDDPLGCVRHLLRSAIGNGRTVAQLLSLAIHDKAAAKGLRSFGLALDAAGKPGFLAVANEHRFLASVFADTPWCGDWRIALAQLPGAQASQTRIAFSDDSARAVFLPRSLVLGIMNPVLN